MNGKNIIRLKAKETDAWFDITPYLASFVPGDGDLNSPDSGRTLDGTMHPGVVTAKEYYDLTFINLDRDTAQKILNLVRKKNKIYMQYPSPLQASGLKTNTFYVQERSIGSPIFVKQSAGNSPATSDYDILWPDISFRLAEI